MATVNRRYGAAGDRRYRQNVAVRLAFLGNALQFSHAA